MFAKKYRLTAKKDFDNVFRYGKAFHADIFIIKTLENKLNHHRFAVIVSKKITSKAVERNQIKRKLREVLKNNQDNFPKNSDIIIYTKKSIKNKNFQEINKQFKLATDTIPK